MGQQHAQGRTFNDAVHKHFSLPPLCIKVIDTPEFQRLRDLKQLGGTYWVFTSASHNRFEHSLGTAYLAGKLAKTLRKNQPQLGIDDKDVLCVQLAGLCHDLGHGPMSHMWDSKFLKRMAAKHAGCLPDGVPTHQSGEKRVPEHEEVSTKLLEHLIDKNDLWPDFEAAGEEPRGGGGGVCWAADAVCTAALPVALLAFIGCLWALLPAAMGAQGWASRTCTSCWR
jgi:HD superfamily phosphohydrolase